jgi:hypothetical protein
LKLALNPSDNRTYTLPEYLRRFGPTHDARMRPNVRERLKCYACTEDVHPIAEDSPDRAYWAHDTRSKASWCPLREPSRQYALLKNGKENCSQAIPMRALFLCNWRKHWGMILSLLSGADIHAFISFIRLADRTRLWGRDGLEEWLIPYIFLATSEGPLPAEDKGLPNCNECVKFWFDARVIYIDDLWTHAPGDVRFMKARYRKPARNTFLTASQFIDFIPISLDPSWTAKRQWVASSYQSKWMLTAFPEAK